MTRATDINRLRKLLQSRRRSLLETALAAHGEVDALKAQERDPEYEENAQSELADYTLSHLLEGQRRELMLIDGALQRLDAGTFGVCVDCDEKIGLDRLGALPFALRCEECAEAQESDLRNTGALAMPTL